VADSGTGSRATAMLRGHGGGFVVLDTEVTEDLAREGLARDLVRAVQGARKDAGLEITDRISLTVVGDDDVWDAATQHQRLVMEETLAVQFGAAGAGVPLPRGPRHNLGGGTDPDGGTQPRITSYATSATLDGGRSVDLLITKVDAR
jgi:isoleucyl-tRNA synthetase